MRIASDTCPGCDGLLAKSDQVDDLCRHCTLLVAERLDWRDVNAYQVGALLLFFEGTRFAGVAVDVPASRTTGGDARPPVSVAQWAARRELSSRRQRRAA